MIIINRYSSNDINAGWVVFGRGGISKNNQFYELLRIYIWILIPINPCPVFMTHLIIQGCSISVGGGGDLISLWFAVVTLMLFGRTVETQDSNNK